MHQSFTHSILLSHIRPCHASKVHGYVKSCRIESQGSRHKIDWLGNRKDLFVATIKFNRSSDDTGVN